MRYYVVAGEASGDLHAARLIDALREADSEAVFRFIGGDEMSRAAGSQPVRHYKALAYMGLLPVLTHLPTILSAMRQVRRDVVEWQPDALILVDYPGFNLQLARYVRSHTRVPVYYYIAPKIWAWKEYRIKDIRRDVTHLLSILPFEVAFFEGKHHYPITYVGNPTVDEVEAYKAAHTPAPAARPSIALLAGSRQAEIRDNLPMMLQAVESLRDRYDIVLAAAPSIPDTLYQSVITRSRCTPPRIVRGDTYGVLSQATAALVTSGTATLETALFRVPQVVCYHIPWLFKVMRPIVLKVPYVSLVNLIADSPIVPELLGDMTPDNIHRHLTAILPGSPAREAQLQGYTQLAQILGPAGAPTRAAHKILATLRHE